MEGSEESKPVLRSSSLYRRLGFMNERTVSERENSGGLQSNAVPETLARVLGAGFQTAITGDGKPVLFRPEDNDHVYELDEESLEFKRRSIKSEEKVGTHAWGCTTPIFSNLAPQDEIPTLFSPTMVSKGEIAFEAVNANNYNAEDNKMVFQSEHCTGFEETADDSFNLSLSKPIDVNELKSIESFHEVFPLDDDNEPIENGFQQYSFKKNRNKGASSSKNNSNKPLEIDEEPIGRIIISYRHQHYGKDRFTYDDWLCAEHSLRKIMIIYQWNKARFWTDARLRKFNRLATQERNNNSVKLPWAEMGIAPYEYGPVVVLSCSQKPSISDRFWLTVERRTGSHFFGTWLTDDAGDLFFFLVPSLRDSIRYYLAIITGVSSSQKLSWPKDREELLQAYYNDLEIENVDSAIYLLKTMTCFESKMDFVREELYEVEIAPRGKTIQWCGDIEALIDPPCLHSIFKSVGKKTQNYPFRALDVGLKLGELKTIAIIFKIEVEFDTDSEEESKEEIVTEQKKTMWCAKRIYIDTNSEEIRGRSTPMLVEESYADNLLASDQVKELNLEHRPKWLCI